MKRFLDYIRKDFYGHKFTFLVLPSIAGLVILITVLAIVRHSVKNEIKVMDSYQVYCIENVRYVSVNGMLTVKHDLSGEIENCELEEME